MLFNPAGIEPFTVIVILSSTLSDITPNSSFSLKPFPLIVTRVPPVLGPTTGVTVSITGFESAAIYMKYTGGSVLDEKAFPSLVTTVT